MSTFVQDLRYAWRVLKRSPGFTLVAVLTLAMGIGANTAIFSMVHTVLFSPLPFKQPDQLVAVYTSFPSLGFEKFWASPPEYFELQSRLQSLEDLGAYTTAAVNVSGAGGEPLRGSAVYATHSLLATLGVEPILGRLYSPAEDAPNQEPLVILGDGLFQRMFGGDRAILGKRVMLDGIPHTVIGVMPPSFAIGGQKADLWLPLALGPQDRLQRTRHRLNLIGRLRPDVSLAQARGELHGLLARWPEELPGDHTPNLQDHPLSLESLLDDLVGQFRPAFLYLWLTVSCLLLIACFNIANLLLVRAKARQRETTVRLALGASTGRLLRQFFAESLLLLLLGGLAGLVLAIWAIRAIVLFHPGNIPRLDAVGFSVWGFCLALLASLITSLVFGVAPLLMSSRREAAGLQLGRTPRRQRLQRGLVVVEVALAATLVIGCGLLLRSFWALRQVDPGLDARGVLSLRISLPPAAYPTLSTVGGFYQRLMARLSSLPGVESAAAMSGMPPKRDVEAVDTTFENVPKTPEGPAHSVDYVQFVTRDYFRTLRIPIVAGRPFNKGDAQGSPGVVVINQTMAKVFWPGRNPLGQRLRRPGEGYPWVTVIGIAEDVKQGGLENEVGTEFYLLADQAPETVSFAPRTLNLVLRTSLEPMSLAEAVRKEVHQLDPVLPVDNVQSLEKALDDSIAQPRFITLLVVVFATVALTLAAVGTYGILASSVEQRTQEIGIRMALGARVESVLRLILKEGMQLVLLGLALGVLLVLALGGMLSRILFNVAPTDALILVSTSVVLIAVSLVACYLPARMAARALPMNALRRE